MSIPGEPLATTEIIGIILFAIIGVGASIILARKKRYRRSIDDVERTHSNSQ